MEFFPESILVLFRFIESVPVMFYVRNFIILILIVVGFFFIYRPRRYEKLRPHSNKRRDYKVQYVGNRTQFNHYLLSKQRHLTGIPDAVDIVVARKQRGRVVGAFVYMNHELLQRNKKLIKDGIVKRDSRARQQHGAPAMDLVKDKVAVNGNKKVALYHLTHLVAFRHSLSEGDFEGLLFAGTAHLNTGARYDLDYAPAYNRTSDSTMGRVDTLKNLFFENKQTLILDCPTVKTRYNFGNRGQAQYSLNDFEHLFDFFVNWKKDHVFKYGVECHYEKGSPLVKHVRVVIIDVTAEKLLVDAILLNKL